LWEAVNQLLVSVSQLKPVVLFIDDLQWADDSTLGLLGYLARQPGQGITLLTAARPIDARTTAAALLQSLTRVDRLARLPLSRLSALEVHQASGKLTDNPSPMLTQWLAERSEGNPYVLIELVRYLRGQGVINAKGELDIDRLSNTPVVPPTVYSLVVSRLAGLSEPSQRVLNAAVAAGRDFELELAGHAAGLSTEAALDAADELAAAGLIQPISEPKPAGGFNRYSFKHNLIMEVAYLDAGEARHRLMHRRVGEAIELLHRRDLDSWAGVLAFHFQETGDLDKAARYAYLAGKRAVRLLAWKEATAFFEQALQVQVAPDQMREIWSTLGEVRILAGEAARASQAYEQALTLAKPGSREASQIKLEIGYTFLLQARFSEAIQLAREVLQAGQLEASQAEFLWGTALSLEGADLDGAGEHLRLAEKYCDPADIQRLAEIKFEQGSVTAQQGSLQEAVRLYQQSLSLAQQAYANGDAVEKALRQMVLANNNLAYHSLLLGDPAAHEYLQAGMQLAREKGVISLLPYLYSTSGEILLKQGQLDGAEASFREGLELAERIYMPERIAGLSANLGLAAVKKGDRAAAIRWLSQAMADADALGTRHLAAQIRIWLAPLLQGEEARIILQEARAIAEDGGRQKLLEEIREVEKTIT
jgi:predicted ATPase